MESAFESLSQVEKRIDDKIVALHHLNSRLGQNVAILRQFLADKAQMVEANEEQASTITDKAVSDCMTMLMKTEEISLLEETPLLVSEETMEDKLDRILLLAKQTRKVSKNKGDIESAPNKEKKRVSRSQSIAEKPESLRQVFIKAFKPSVNGSVSVTSDSNSAQGPSQQHRLLAKPLANRVDAKLEASGIASSVDRQLAILKSRRSPLQQLCHTIFHVYNNRNAAIFSQSPSLLLQALLPGYQDHWQRIARSRVWRVELLQQERYTTNQMLKDELESKFHRRDEKEMLQLVSIWYRALLLDYLLQNSTPTSQPPAHALKLSACCPFFPLHVMPLLEKLKAEEDVKEAVKLTIKWRRIARQELGKNIQRFKLELLYIIESRIGATALPYVIQCVERCKRQQVSKEEWRQSLRFLRSIVNILVFEGNHANCLYFLAK
jgi:hypothetical protein